MQDLGFKVKTVKNTYGTFYSVTCPLGVATFDSESMTELCLEDKVHAVLGREKFCKIIADARLMRAGRIFPVGALRNNLTDLGPKV